MRTPKSRISDGKKTADNVLKCPLREERISGARERRDKNGEYREKQRTTEKRREETLKARGSAKKYGYTEGSLKPVRRDEDSGSTERTSRL